MSAVGLRMTPDDLLALFHEAADVQVAALAPLTDDDRRRRTDRLGQYALDLVADEAVGAVLARPGLAVLSEESGRTGPAESPITIVVDPVDGSTNCARGLPYWAISLCALDAWGPLCALVANSATGERTTAVRGGGAWRDGRRMTAAPTTRVEDAFVALAGIPRALLPWKQYRALGSAALTLCDVAGGRIDAFLDCVPDAHGPWDYLGGLLVCTEAGATVIDVGERPLAVAAADARRQVVAASTPELLDALLLAVPGA